MAKENKQAIKCEVRGCKYYSNKDLCTLPEIKVCNCDCDHADEKEDTLCGSYKTKKAE